MHIYPGMILPTILRTLTLYIIQYFEVQSMHFERGPKCVSYQINICVLGAISKFETVLLWLEYLSYATQNNDLILVFYTNLYLPSYRCSFTGELATKVQLRF